MDADRLRNALEVFEAALGLPPVERGALLDARCGDDPGLRADVEALLAADGAAEGPVTVGGGAQQFLAANLGAEPEDLADDRPIGRPLVGQYRVIRVIGQGGMGTVYEAEQSFPRRRVALKAIRPGLITRPMLRRFEYEAHILGRLQHPGIAQIYEAGIDDGSGGKQAYFALEYVEGEPLDEYCRKHALSREARLELIARVCDAVQYAHQRGVIHRDLKPANILVQTERIESRGPVARTSDAPARPAAAVVRRAIPKILDFGVARLTADDEGVTLVHTREGQIVGTLPYMSPEQVSGEPDLVDTRTDVYALGVLLFQVLTGRLPIEVRDCGLPEAIRRIHEQSPTRLGALDRTLRGEIETIVAKALEKDRERRYQSASELADDLSHHLAGEPITARRDSTFYVLRKTLARYRGYVWAASLFIAGLTVFSIVTLLQSEQNRLLAIEERAAREQADASADFANRMRQRADHNAARLTRELTENNIERGRLLGINGSLLAAEDLIWTEYLRDPNNRQAYWALWELYARQPLLRSVFAHDLAVQHVRVANDTLAATAGRDKLIKLWDLTTGRCMRTLEGHTERVLWVEFTADRRRLVSGAHDRTVRIWDVETGACLDVIEVDDLIWNVALSPDQRLIAATGDTGAVYFWDAATLTCVGQIDGPRRPARASLFHHDPDAAANFVWCSDSSEIFLYHVDYGAAGAFSATRVNVLRGHTNATVSLAISPDGQTLVTGSSDRWMRFWDLNSGAVLRAVNPNNGSIRVLRFTADGTTLAAGGWWTVDLFGGQTWTKLRSLTTHYGVFTIDVTPDGRIVAPDGEMPRNHLRIWELRPNAAVETRSFRPQAVGGIGVSPDGRRAIVTGSGSAMEWDLETRARVQDLPPEFERASFARYSPDGRQVALVLRGFGVRVWDTETRALVTSIESRTTNGQPMDFSPDGTRLILSRPDGAFVLYSLPDGAPLKALAATPSEPLWARFTTDGKRLITVSRDNRVRVWDADSGEALRELRINGDPQPWCIEVSPDGRLLAAGTWGRTVELFDLESYDRLAILSGHNQLVTALSFDPRPGSDLLASCSNDGTVRVWDVREPRILLTLDDEVTDIYQVAWRPGHDELLTVGAQGTFSIWDLSYYQRHIAGNLEYQVEQRRDVYATEADFQAARDWARSMRLEYWGGE